MASTSKTEEKEETDVLTELSLWFNRTTEAETPQEEARHSGILQELKSNEDLWKIKKALTKSDVNSSCRLLLGKVPVEEQILPLMDENCGSDCRTKEGEDWRRVMKFGWGTMNQDSTSTFSRKEFRLIDPDIKPSELTLLVY
ncbi:hypothetical protein LguiB_028863 [Lonicera macranthoides]